MLYQSKVQLLVIGLLCKFLLERFKYFSKEEFISILSAKSLSVYKFVLLQSDFKKILLLASKEFILGLLASTSQKFITKSFFVISSFVSNNL